MGHPIDPGDFEQRIQGIEGLYSADSYGDMYFNGGIVTNSYIWVDTNPPDAPYPNAELSLDCPVLKEAKVVYYTNGLRRWTFTKNPSAESGGNAGSDFVIYAFSDDGTTGLPALALTRSDRTLVTYGPLILGERFMPQSTITPAGTVGAQTINKAAGSVNFAAGATSLVVTSSYVTTNSLVLCTVMSNDTTMKAASATVANGSFTLRPNANPTAETKVAFLVVG